MPQNLAQLPEQIGRQVGAALQRARASGSRNPRSLDDGSPFLLGLRGRFASRRLVGIACNGVTG